MELKRDNSAPATVDNWLVPEIRHSESEKKTRESESKAVKRVPSQVPSPSPYVVNTVFTPAHARTHARTCSED